jgi:hypothetical protein
MLISGIEWDTDGVDPSELGLPLELSVDTDAEEIRGHEDLADWLSEKYGWAVSAYSCDPPFDANEKPVAFAP